MCGIIAYIGRKPAQNVILEGLRRLEYRGYDSAGLCIINNKQFELRKKAGRINDLAAVLAKQPAKGDVGIGHTRWATHGPPTDANAHPHLDQSGKIASSTTASSKTISISRNAFSPKATSSPRRPTRKCSPILSAIIMSRSMPSIPAPTARC